MKAATRVLAPSESIAPNASARMPEAESRGGSCLSKPSADAISDLRSEYESDEQRRANHREHQAAVGGDGNRHRDDAEGDEVIGDRERQRHGPDPCSRQAGLLEDPCENRHRGDQQRAGQEDEERPPWNAGGLEVRKRCTEPGGPGHGHRKSDCYRGNETSIQAS